MLGFIEKVGIFPRTDKGMCIISSDWHFINQASPQNKTFIAERHWLTERHWLIGIYLLRQIMVTKRL